MSSPNMNASSILRNQSSRTTSFSTNLSGMKTVFVGKDQHPVTIMQMAHVNDPAWKKAASFENLRNNAHSLLEAHSIADIMALIANEVPMDTGAAFQEAQAATAKIMDEVFNVENLHPSAFLNSDGKTVKFTPTVGLKERPDDLTYFRFQCDLDGSEVDKRVTTAGEFNFQFCLRLPQHLFCVKDDTVETISLSGKKRGQAKSMVEFMTELEETYMSPAAKVLFRGGEDGGEDEVGERDEEVEDREDLANLKTTRTKPSPISPKFKGMYGKDEKEYKRGYYGPLTFFDTQNEFHNTFGGKPILLASNPMGTTSGGVKDKLRAYGESCKLDIYLSLCEQDYVGEDLVDNALNAQEVCRRIGALKQEWKDVGGRTKLDTPDEIFNKYLQLSTSLPTDALSWPIQLCSSFFAALTPELAERMTTDSFRMPSLVMLTTKAKQLEALRVVRRQAALSYKSLEEERVRMAKLMKQMVQQRGGGGRGNSYVTTTTGDQEVDDNPQQEQEPRVHNQVYFQRGPSLAETTIERYKGPAPSTESRPEVETRICRDTGLQHPYDREKDYLSKYPVGFRGCYACGKDDHRSSRECPLNQTGQFDKNVFFLEMWAHKPHTKKSQFESRGNHYSPARAYLTGTDDNNGTQSGSRYNDSRYGQSNDNQHGSRYNDNRAGNNEIQNGSRTNESRYGPRNINNDPSWMQSRGNNYAANTASRDAPNAPPRTDDKSKKPRLFVYAARVFAASIRQHQRLRHMPLDLDNGLPAIEVRFGSNTNDETCFLCHVDSCAAMNTGNLLMHEWIMTTYPGIVCSYEKFDDENPFEPLSLACAVSIEDLTATYGQLTSVVTYHTQYRDEKGASIKLSFGLGAEVAVNAIIGLPTLRKWKASIDIGNDNFVSKLLDLSFPLFYQGADSGLPNTITFKKGDFVRPRPITKVGRAFVVQTDDISAGITDASRFDTAITASVEDTSKGYLQREVENKE